MRVDALVQFSLRKWLCKEKLWPDIWCQRVALTDIFEGDSGADAEDLRAIARVAHVAVRATGLEIPELPPRWTAAGMNVAAVQTLDISEAEYDPVNRLIRYPSRGSPADEGFDVLHELAHALLGEGRGTHADVQRLACFLAVERLRAERAIARHGLLDAALKLGRESTIAPVWMVAMGVFAYAETDYWSAAR